MLDSYGGELEAGGGTLNTIPPGPVLSRGSMCAEPRMLGSYGGEFEAGGGVTAALRGFAQHPRPALRPERWSLMLQTMQGGGGIAIWIAMLTDRSCHLALSHSPSLNPHVNSLGCWVTM